MPMDRETHETLLNELLDTEIEHSRRAEILQELRVDYSGVIGEHEEHSQTIEKLQADNSDLVVSNSKLFRQLGVVGDDKAEEQEEQKNFSESITLEELEKDV